MEIPWWTVPAWAWEKVRLWVRAIRVRKDAEVAIHEAAHAVLALRLGVPIEFDEIKRRRGLFRPSAWGVTRGDFVPLIETKSTGTGRTVLTRASRRSIDALAILTLAGGVAEQELLPGPRAPAWGRDFDDIVTLRDDVRTKCPRWPRHLGKYVDRMFWRASAIVRRNGREIHAVAAELVKRGRLSREDVEAMVPPAARCRTRSPTPPPPSRST